MRASSTPYSGALRSWGSNLGVLNSRVKIGEGGCGGWTLPVNEVTSTVIAT